MRDWITPFLIIVAIIIVMWSVKAYGDPCDIQIGKSSNRTLTWKGNTVTPEYPLQIFSGDVLSVDGITLEAGENAKITSIEEFDEFVRKRCREQ